MGSLDPNELYFWERFKKNRPALWLTAIVIAIAWWLAQQ